MMDHDCTPCGAGYYGDEAVTHASLQECHACPAGTFQPVGNQHQLNSEFGISKCKQCPVGFWSADEAHSGIKSDPLLPVEDVCGNECDNTCNENEFMSANCSATANRECTPQPQLLCDTAVSIVYTEKSSGTPLLPGLSGIVAEDLVLHKAIVTLNGTGLISSDTLSLNESAPGFTNPKIGFRHDAPGEMLLISEDGASLQEFESSLRAILFESNPSTPSNSDRTLAAAVTIYTRRFDGVFVPSVQTCELDISVISCAACMPSIVPEVVAHTLVQDSGECVMPSAEAVIEDQDSDFMENATVVVSCTACAQFTIEATISSPDIVVERTSSENYVTLKLRSTTSNVSISDYEAVIRGISVCQQPAEQTEFTFEPLSLTYTVSDYQQQTSAPAVRFISIHCKPGTFHNDLAICEPCTDGYYQEQPGQNQCVPCDAGTFGTGDKTNSTYCLPCPAGSYTSEPAQHSECIQCLPGSFGDASIDQSSADYCVDCPNGRATGVGEHGMYAQAGEEGCTQCETGTYNDGSDPEMRKECSTWSCCTCNGQYQAGGTHEEDASCLACIAGQYLEIQSDYEGICHAIRECTLCERGKIAALNIPTKVAHHCADCEPGRYEPNEGQVPPPNGAPIPDQQPGLGCAACPRGEYAPGFSNAECDDCDAGSYTDAEGTTECIECAQGKYGNAEAPEGMRTSDYCTSCDAGQYQDRPKQISCIACACGTFQNSTGQAQCEMCAAGQFRERDGTPMTSCSACSAGHFAGEGACVCTDCPRGEFCPDGEVCGVNATRIVNVTQVGDEFVRMVTHAQTAGVCQACNVGQYNEWFGRDECQHCPDGHYQDEKSYSTCNVCPAGKFSKFTSEQGAGNQMETCENCPPGQFMGSVGADACQICPAGKHTAGAYGGAESCEVCEPGRFSADNANNCEECGAGQYQPSFNSSSCIDCEEGTFNPLTGRTHEGACTACPSGTYASAAGQASCHGVWDCCGRGEYLEFDSTELMRTSQGECKTCPYGKFQPASTTCSPDTACQSWTECEAGQYLAPPSQNSACITDGFDGPSEFCSGQCIGCPVGQFSNAWAWQSQLQAQLEQCVDSGCSQAIGECMQQASPHKWTEAQGTCDPWSAGDWVAPQTCENCAAGTYGIPTADQSGGWTTVTDACSECPLGQYQSQVGQALCESCAEGQYSVHPSDYIDTTTGDVIYPLQPTCAECKAHDWGAWSTCSQSCGGGTQHRVRDLFDVCSGMNPDPAACADEYSIAQCPEREERACEPQECPSSDTCHSIKCRYAANPATGVFGIQVYHHRDEPHQVHHCKLYDANSNSGSTQEKHCVCKCWNKSAFDDADDGDN
jgi:hypothetical protein